MGEQLIAAQHGLQFFYGMHGSFVGRASFVVCPTTSC